MVKNNFHQEILKEIKKYSGNEVPNREGFGLKYVGTDKVSYHLNTKDTRQIAKGFTKVNQFDLDQYVELIDSLYRGESHDEINIAAKIIEFSPEFRKQFDVNYLDSWLENVHGWAETDTLCQMAFTDIDLLSNWPNWQKLIKKLSTDKNVHKRRASLVLLTKPVRLSADSKLSFLAFENIDKLKSEKDILITKAVSWILRSLIKNHQQEVAKYLDKNLEILPKIAVREVTTKLLTGKKYIKNKPIK
ncbi:MAG: DNA alkylation repair protein [Candidatus Shapirobacteria bacterium]